MLRPDQVGHVFNVPHYCVRGNVAAGLAHEKTEPDQPDDASALGARTNLLVADIAFMIVELSAPGM